MISGFDLKSMKYVVVAGFLYLLPIFLAGSYYMDDVARALYGYGWSKDGRLFSTVLMNAIEFRSRNIGDIFPLGQIVGMIILAVCGVMLARRILPASSRETALICACAVPLFANPFFLENLSYKYDCLPMCIAQGLAVLPALLFQARTGRNVVVNLFVLIAIMAFYQPGLNSFFSICLLVFVADCLGGAQRRRAFFDLLFLGACSIPAFVLYHYLIAAPTVRGYYATTRSVVISPDDAVGDCLVQNFQSAFMLFRELFHGGFGAIIIAMYVFASLFVLSRSFVNIRGMGIAGWLSGVLMAVSPLLFLLMVPGIVMSLKNEVIEPRIFMSFSVCLIFASMVMLATPIGHRVRYVVFLPVAFLFMFSYAYGDALREQERYNTALAQTVTDRLYQSGFAADDTVLTYGHAPRSDIVNNATRELPLLRRILPRDTMGPDEFLGYVALQRSGLKFREHSDQEWRDGRKILTDSRPIYSDARFSIYRAGQTYCVSFADAVGSAG